jgi:hypothetical protein
VKNPIVAENNVLEKENGKTLKMLEVNFFVFSLIFLRVNERKQVENIDCDNNFDSQNHEHAL